MMTVDDALKAVMDAHAQLVMRVAELERRNDNTVRHGKVTDVDTKKWRARIEIGERDGQPVKSAWVPYGQLAGEYKSHRPPTVGQQMTLFAPNGEIRQGVLLPFTWWEDNKAPSDKPDEHVTTYGKLKVVEKAESYELSVDKAKITFSTGKVTITVGSSEVEVTEAGCTIVGDRNVIAGSTYAGMDAKDDTAGMKVDINDGIPAKKLFTKK
ncbi:phage baseplate assembly protein V [Klebsiella pneumoniae]